MSQADPHQEVLLNFSMDAKGIRAVLSAVKTIGSLLESKENNLLMQVAMHLAFLAGIVYWLYSYTDAFVAALALLAAGFVFAVLSLVLDYLGPAPWPPGSSPAVILVLAVVLLFFFPPWPYLEEGAAKIKPEPFLLGAALSIYWVYWLDLTFFLSRLKQVEPVGFELDFVDQLVLPLLGEVEEGSKLALSFNPFGAVWSQLKVPPTRSRPGYSFQAYLRQILRLKLPLDAGASMTLLVLHFRQDKIKNRKSKYKGTRHVVRCLYKLAGPRIARLPDSDGAAFARRCGEKLAALAASGEKAKIESLWFRPDDDLPDFKIKAGKSGDTLWLSQSIKLKTDVRELGPDDVLDPAFVLESVRALCEESLAPSAASRG